MPSFHGITHFTHNSHDRDHDESCGWGCGTVGASAIMGSAVFVNNCVTIDTNIVRGVAKRPVLSTTTGRYCRSLAGCLANSLSAIQLLIYIDGRHARSHAHHYICVYGNADGWRIPFTRSSNEFYKITRNPTALHISLRAAVRCFTGVHRDLTVNAVNSWSSF